MAGLESRSFKESYKSVIIISGASSGAGEVHQQLTDGAGTTIPLYVASGSIRIESGKKMYFADTDLKNYIYNSGTGVLNLVAEDSVNISPKLIVPGTASIASLFVSEAAVTSIKGGTASFTGEIKAPTINATTVRATTVSVTTLSATTIKGNFDTTKGGAFKVASGNVQFGDVTDAYKIGLGESKTVDITAETVKTMRVGKTKVIPGVGGIDLGANAAASRWQNIFGASAFHKNLTASTVTVKGGAASLTTAKGTTASFKVVKATSEMVLDASLYLDKDKATKIIGGESVRIHAVRHSLVFASDNSLYPYRTEDSVLGVAANPWQVGHVSALKSNSISSTSALTIKAKGYYLYASGIPTTSAWLKKGGVYQSAGTLKIKMGEIGV